MRIVEIPNHIPSGADQAIGRVRFAPSGDAVTLQTGLYERGPRDCFSPDIFHRLEIASGKLRSARAEGPIHWNWPALSDDGRFAATAFHWSSGDFVLRLWEPRSGGPMRGVRLPAHLGSVHWVGFAPDGKLYVGVNGSYSTPRENRIALLRVDTESAVRRYDQPDSPKTPEFRPGPQTITPEMVLEGAAEVVAELDGILTPWNPAAFTPDGGRMAMWTDGGPALVLESGSGRLLHEVAWEGPDTLQRHAFRLAFNPDGEQLALIGRGRLVCRRSGESGAAWRAKRAVGYVTAAAFHPDGRTLFAVNAKGQVHRLDARTGKSLESFDWGPGPLLCVAVSPQGTVAAAGGRGNNLILWDVDS